MAVETVSGFGAAPGLRGRGGKYDRAMYYRRPKTNRGGVPLEQADWIVIGSRTQMEHMMLRGFEPLLNYGYIPSADPELRDDDGNAAPLRSPWYPILAHPKGPSEFPADQVLTFRWYKPEECPNPKARFPQLSGHKVTEFPCPECSRIFYGVDDLGKGIRGLATHLRLGHEWNREAMLSYGSQVGIDFNVIYGDLKKTYEFTGNDAGTDEALSCDECDYVAPSDAKYPLKSLRMHKLGAHKPLEVETVA